MRSLLTHMQAWILSFITAASSPSPLQRDRCVMCFPWPLLPGRSYLEDSTKPRLTFSTAGC